MKLRACAVMILALTAADPLVSCTIVFASSDSGTRVGNNLDCDNFFPRVWFIPAGEGRYGRFCFGTDPAQHIAEGGMNDQGLYIGVNALDQDTAWAADPDLPDWEEWDGWLGAGVPDGILAKCATVDEAIEVFRGYNLFTLGRVKFLLADKSGDSVVVEWSRLGLRFVRRGDARYQVSTNFVGSDFEFGREPCYRYSLAQRMLGGGSGMLSHRGLRRILAATHLEFQTPTVLSVIFGLDTGEISLYYFHNFEEELRFELAAELAKGPHGGSLNELFEVKPYVAQVYEDFSRAGGD